MFDIIFYRDVHGHSEIISYLDELKIKSEKSKSDRIQREKILTYIGALSEYGTRLGSPYIKHIQEKIWELRPLNHRIFFFYWKDDQFVLLSHYKKKTRKAPEKEIRKAKNNLIDFIERNG